MILKKGGEGHGLLRWIHTAVCDDNLQPHGAVEDGPVIVDIFEGFQVRTLMPEKFKQIVKLD